LRHGQGAGRWCVHVCGRDKVLMPSCTVLR
jgi:hypothetical protein